MLGKDNRGYNPADKDGAAGNEESGRRSATGGFIRLNDKIEILPFQPAGELLGNIPGDSPVDARIDTGSDVAGNIHGFVLKRLVAAAAQRDANVVGPVPWRNEIIVYIYHPSGHFEADILESRVVRRPHGIQRRRFDEKERSQNIGGHARSVNQCLHTLTLRYRRRSIFPAIRTPVPVVSVTKYTPVAAGEPLALLPSH